MARYHVKADGSMGVCTAKEGNCPFGGAEGTKHFTSESEARSYSEKIVAEQSRSSKGLKRANGGGGSKVPPDSAGSAFADSPYNGWASVPDPEPNADNAAEELTKDMGLTKLPDPHDPMTKARHHVMERLGALDSKGGFQGPSYYEDLPANSAYHDWHYLHESPDTIISDSYYQDLDERETLDLKDMGLGNIPKEDVTINDLPFGFEHKDLLSNYYGDFASGEDKTLISMRSVQLHRDGTGTYWSYDINGPEAPEDDEDYWDEYNPLDHTLEVTFDASSPEAIDKFFDSIKK